MTVFLSKSQFTEMKKIYSSCDILLKLSRVEGFFGPPMEMMACGGAVVVGRVTGYDEYITDGFNALVVDPLDVQAASDAVKRLIEDKALYSKLVANGKVLLLNGHGKALLTCLKNVTAGHFHPMKTN